MRITSIEDNFPVGAGWECGDGLWRLTHKRGAGAQRFDGSRRRKIPRFTNRDGVQARRELMAYDLEHWNEKGIEIAGINCRQERCSHQWSQPYGFDGDEQQTCSRCKAHREAK